MRDGGESATVAALRRYLTSLPEDLAGSPLAASALVMAALVDDDAGSFTARSMCQARLQDALRELRELAPPREDVDAVNDIEQQRAKRRAGLPGAAS